MTWGAAQLGIAQGVLDAVADGVLEARRTTLLLVAVWVDPAAHDEAAVKRTEPRRGPRRRRCATAASEASSWTWPPGGTQAHNAFFGEG